MLINIYPLINIDQFFCFVLVLSRHSFFLIFPLTKNILPTFWQNVSLLLV